MTSKGDKADGIHSKAGGGTVTIENYTVRTEGESADGINLGRELNELQSTVLINNAQIYSEGGMGIRANSSVRSLTPVTSIIINDQAGIETAAEGSSIAGYAVFAGKDTENNSSETAMGQAVIALNGNSTIKTAGGNAHGVYARENGTISLNNTHVETAGNNAHALFASTSTADQAATINLRGNTALQSGAGYAAYASGELATIRSWDDVNNLATSGIYTVEGDIVADKAGRVTLDMAEGSQFTGKTNSNQLADSASTAGEINLALSGASSLWTMTGDSVLSQLNLDGATLKYQPPKEGSTFTPMTLTVAGDYTGNGGTLALNTVLGGDNSLTDKLIVKGNTSGSTNVAINNIGGAGEQTVEGIEIVEVGGNSEGTFAKAGRIVAGGYDYDVVKKASNWYLTSHLTPVEPEEPTEVPIDPPDPVDPPDTPDPVNPPVDPVDPPAPPATGVNQYRPEFGSYLANNYAANTLFITRLHDRLGETQYTDMLTGERKVTSMWMRHEGGHTRFTDGSGQLKTQANRYVLQIGGDIAQWTSDGLDRWHLGVMAGYANQKSRTHNTHNGYSSRGQVDGYSIGLYATWYANEENKTGTYLDSWVLYNWFDNKVTGKHLASEKYDSDGITASVEGGYTFLVGESERATYWIQPKAQAIWMDVQADTHRERNGTVVKDKTDGNLMTRLGVRAYLKGHSAIDDGKGREFQPFVEANWIHNTRNQTVQMGTIRNDISGTKNIGELKAGVEGQINPRLQVWGNVAQQIGDNGYSDTAAMLGIKYSF
nr:autotransporter outer membrane beta-barrel domain-containing protein [Shimwellia blattae]